MRGERGFALVIALIVTTLLVALLAEFVNEVYVDTSHSHNFVASQQAGVLAESGVTGGIKLLQLSSTLRTGGEQCSSLLEPWAQPRTIDVENGTVSIAIEEESGKLDLNAATSQTGTPDPFQKDALLRLFDNLKLSRDLYDPLADWVDTDDTPRPNGAEKNYYGALKTPLLVHNDKLDTLEELALVKGYTPEVLAKLRGLVTVYGVANGTSASAALININTAPKEVLMSLDDSLMTGDQVAQILEYRKTKVIKTLADVFGSSTLTQALSLKVGFKGSIYRIRSEGKVGESVRIVEAVVSDVEATQPRILYWREY
ncbi:type II secretion system minor pseudopilin GspK [Geomonas subterranea]|uniref:Type II secretion system minor pseudopilin GspK n=1 Tax=Geomonas subterranea TaxID=2847989 RepID=A0ABX8LBM3_9BACT|nr:type II secretion system minor pseudopilin GspK [Geomonas subterranea]QXE89421.1 type II secretion system minor pseudopilin GspK [Geomonas subterranea]QXM08463.1 type II secretion system minor pseudopilin GspK [Geomonas subterranea]